VRGAGRGARGAMMGTVPLNAYLILSAILFAIGVIGVVVRRNVLIIFMAIELMLNAVNLTFVAFSRFLVSMDGQIIVLFVMAVAAAEVALGLAIIIALYRNKESVQVDEINLLRG
jgi:NADH-quinone oxidoreductase subunit K